MDEYDDDQWLRFDAGWGAVPVRSGGLAASILDPDRPERRRREQIERGTMTWSLGPLADLLWMLVPESRPLIYELARAEFEYAIQHGDTLTPVGTTCLASAVYTDLLRPALRDLPAGRDLAGRVCAVLRRAETLSPHHRDVVEQEIFAPLDADGFGPAFAELAERAGRTPQAGE